MIRLNLRRSVVFAVAAAALLGLAVPTAADAAARRVRAGDSCRAVQGGLTTTTAPTLMCWQLILRSGARVWKWLPVDPTVRYPSDATVRRYGGVVAAGSTTTVAPAPGAPTTTAAPAAGASRGAACLEGKWTADFQALNAYVTRSSGAPGPFFSSGSHTYEFRGGVLTGNGAVTMNADPSGLISGSATAVNRATYTATDTQLTLNGTSTLIIIDIRISGQPLNIPFAAGGTGTATYQCSGSTLTISTALPSGTSTALNLTRVA